MFCIHELSREQNAKATSESLENTPQDLTQSRVRNPRAPGPTHPRRQTLRQADEHLLREGIAERELREVVVRKTDPAAGCPRPGPHPSGVLLIKLDGNSDPVKKLRRWILETTLDQPIMV